MEGITPITTLSSGPAWTWLDIALLAGLLGSVVLGAWRGLVTELLALMGWVVAWLAARFLGADVARHVPVGQPGDQLNVLSGMVLAFVGAWLAWALLSWGISKLIQASGLGGSDRLLGAVFGLLRGLLAALAVYVLVSMTPVAQADSWRASRGVAWLGTVLQGLRPILPPEVVQFLPAPSMP
ncbi:CvpA family protein [Aquabacterium parvum]|uniref:CvpA family protein n=1 Tax=Aquabacterium parvum TaxID=70584 RepID=UPI001F41462B|nr:CvpA family protein [Aquabacterium parvum]